MTTMTTITTIFELIPLKDSNSMMCGLSVNPHSDALEYLASNPNIISWMHLFQHNTHPHILEFLFTVGIINKTTLKIQSTSRLFEYAIQLCISHDPFDNGYFIDHEEVHEHEIVQCMWGYLASHSSPLALKIIQSNMRLFQAILASEIKGPDEKGYIQVGNKIYSRNFRCYRRFWVHESMMKNTNSKALALFYKLLPRPGLETLKDSNFWLYGLCNTNPDSMRFVRENIALVVASFHKLFYPHLVGEQPDLFLKKPVLSQAFCETLDDMSCNPRNEAEAQFVDMIFSRLTTCCQQPHGACECCICSLYMNPYAASWLLKKKILLNTRLFSRNTHTSAVNHLLQNPDLIDWGEFAEFNTSPLAIQHMSENRDKLDMTRLASNENPEAIAILCEMLETTPRLQPIPYKTWARLAQNPVSQAIDILEEHANEIGEHSFMQILRETPTNTNPRWLALLGPGNWKDRLNLYDPWLLTNPVIFETPEYCIQGADYVLK